MHLHPRLAALMSVMRAPDLRAPVDELRRRFWRIAQALEGDAPAMQAVQNMRIAGAAGALPARLYTPFAAGGTGPGLLFFHGGGFVVGDLESHDVMCRRLAESARVRVLAVAYRLAPEHKFPAAVEDAAAAAHWLAAHGPALNIDSARLAVGGDSAGGNLATVTALAARRTGPPLRAQLLIYPSTQWVRMTPSQVRLREGHLLTQAVQDFFKRKYLTHDEEAHDVRCSPLLENDLHGMPATYIVTGGLDPLSDEGAAYGQKLAACGVPVTHRHYPNELHGFFSMTAVSRAAREALRDAGAWLACALA
ncbi:MAG: alpha/beta hydrolase [Hyphomonadaceae bacterium]